MPKETENIKLALYDSTADKETKIRALIDAIVGYNNSNATKIDAKTKTIDTNISVLHDYIIGEDGNVVFYNKQEVFLAVHPVGSIFLSTDGTEPAELYGGTWEQIKDVFLLGASDTYPAGSTGGSAEHEHEYKLSFVWYQGNVIGYPSNAIDTYDYINKKWKNNNTKISDDIYALANNALTDSRSEHSPSQTYSVTGNTAAGSSVPPYYSLYIWRRIS